MYKKLFIILPLTVLFGGVSLITVLYGNTLGANGAAPFQPKDIYTQMIQHPSSVKVIMHTNRGNITLKLFPHRTPKTVANFLSYARKGAYDNTIFHKVISGLLIQGGGYTKDFKHIAAKAPVINEASTQMPNMRGTIVMARNANPNSARSEFFINLDNNTFMDIPHGYTVFGKVISGMETIDAIGQMKTEAGGPFKKNVPCEPVVIHSIDVLKSTTKNSQSSLPKHI